MRSSVTHVRRSMRPVAHGRALSRSANMATSQQTRPHAAAPNFMLAVNDVATALQATVQAAQAHSRRSLQAQSL